MQSESRNQYKLQVKSHVSPSFWGAEGECVGNTGAQGGE